MSDEDGDERPRDVLLVGPPTEGGGFAVLRERADRLEVGEVRALREGVPITGELVKLRRRPEHERLFDVEVLADVSTTRSGPAQVASEAYRTGWEAIFGAVPARDDEPS